MAIHRETQKATYSVPERVTTIEEPGKGIPPSARETIAEAGSRANELSAAVGDSLRSAAEAIRERTPGEGVLGNAAIAVADRLEGAGVYLQEEPITAIADDVAGVIRRYPVQSLLIGATVGFLLGRMRR